MSYLIDTNVISEIIKPKQNIHVLNWFKMIPNDALYLSVLTIGEIRKGIEKLPKDKRRNQLISWLAQELPKFFGTRLLAITEEIADRWGFLTAHSKKTLPVIDGLLAATALTHNLKIVTRNTKDFDLHDLELINPFE